MLSLSLSQINHCELVLSTMRTLTHLPLLQQNYGCRASAPSQSSSFSQCAPQYRHSTTTAVFFSTPPSRTTASWTSSFKPRRNTTIMPTRTATNHPLGSSSSSVVPARDRMIDFGRHKGKMLGTLPSTYLKWISKNLRARDFEEWAKLADEVLADPIYRDRIEWEFAQKLLNADVLVGSGAVPELLELSDRFGWDNDDKAGWSRVDFGLLGTSKGGRIPRKVKNNHSLSGLLKHRDSRLKEKDSMNNGDSGAETTKRRERRERLRQKREILSNSDGAGSNDNSSSSSYVDEEKMTMMIAARNQDTDHSLTVVINPGPFPGRASLLNKALS